MKIVEFNLYYIFYLQRSSQRIKMNYNSKSKYTEQRRMGR